MILFQKVCKGYTFCWDFPSVSVGKESAWMQETWVQSVGLENFLPGEGKCNPLQYFAWKIPRIEGPVRLQSVGLQWVGHDLATKPPPPYICMQYFIYLQNFLCNPMNYNPPGSLVHGNVQARIWHMDRFDKIIKRKKWHVSLGFIVFSGK